MEPQACIKNFAESLAARARYGFAGEKPVAVWAMTLVAGEGRHGLSGLQLLEACRDDIRARFLSLADEYGQMKSAAGSWSVITGSEQELQRALRADPRANGAFRLLMEEEAASLNGWFLDRAGTSRRANPSAKSPSPTATRARPHGTTDAWHINLSDDKTIVEAWASFRLPFEPKAEQRNYRDALRQALSALRASEGVEAVYISRSLPANCDVENVLIYNVGSSAFQHLSSKGIAFAYCADTPPPISGGKTLEHFVRYRAFGDADQLKSQVSEPLIAEITEVPLHALVGFAKPGEIWREIMRALDCRGPLKDECEVQGFFGVQISLQMPSRLTNLSGQLKPLFDGVISALHRPTTIDPMVCHHISVLINESESTVAHWVTQPRPVVISRACPVELYRGSVRWHPDDCRMRVGRVLLSGESSTPSMTITVFEAGSTEALSIEGGSRTV